VFVCGEDGDAKQTVRELLQSFGWPDEDIIDLGGIESARGTEMYLPLWLRTMGAVGGARFNIAVLRG
jgi:predicted dinucleotide-binding enzyme